MDKTKPPATRPSARSLLDAYDVVVFDCDGVLLDSNAFKTQAFAEVLREAGYPEPEIEAFVRFQRANFGLSRYRLFEALLEGRFGPKRPVALDALLAAYGRRCRAGYLEQAETPGMRAALSRAGAGGRPLYIVSGSDETELRQVLARRELAPEFAAIYGSPATKPENLARVRRHHAFLGSSAGARILFVGDAVADMEAAERQGADFLFMARFSTVRETLEPRARAAGWPVIEDLTELA